MTSPENARPARRTSVAAIIAQVLLGLFLLVAGIGHLTVARDAFQAQVPTWLPIDVDFVVVASGVVEIVLGLSLLVLWRWRPWVGWVVAAFFVAIFPGNISQFTTGTDSFGLNDDLSRGIRLLFQPLLVLWALWSTGAWKAWRAWRAERDDAKHSVEA
ncbi:hypothetical protein D9V29_10100 [Mycetocola manganoxydans]|uniref:DoxX family membrane protein n=1 Tax=Mycetocola manganoxydans TaxID=699879 RepID=A0A3L6ZS97_9MICO|nr:hypothetical protein [Mycetocola manganoxydans]RLP70826.1 hypothetical protein D9V29_10100 [Mycetocola manganoxydans]GHD48115.1 membrane protein [Mycetocola manganoxydans]